MTILPFGTVRMSCRARLSTGQVLEVNQHVDERVLMENVDMRAEVERQLRFKLIEKILEHAPPIISYEN